MARDTRSVVDVGFELMGVSTVEADEPAAEEATEAEVLGALVAQVQAMMDRLAIDGRLERLESMLINQATLLMQLADMITQPRRRIPVRDEAGNITEVMDIYAPTSAVEPG